MAAAGAGEVTFPRTGGARAERAAKDPYTYECGFGNHVSSEAAKGALPVGQNTPQKAPLGLYTEQLSGTAFTVPRADNKRSWLYRILPSVAHSKYVRVEKDGSVAAAADGAAASAAAGDKEVVGASADAFTSKFCDELPGDPSQFRWDPPAVPGKDAGSVDFVQGLRTFAGAGDASVKAGCAIHMYAANASMVDKSFYNADGDFLIVPQLGTLDITTELGKMYVQPGEICVVPRGIQFAVNLPDGTDAIRGYICEVYDGHFKLPDLGPIGANGLANPRDFKIPVAWYENRKCDFTVVGKFLGDLWTCKRDHSVFNVVAFHGNYTPYKYDLDDFCVVNSVSYDHLDPCIFTVLTCQTQEPGVAVCDFVIFPPRFMVQEGTFRPPYYHKNLMSEYMGLIRGEYEAKVDGGFVPGGGSLHSALSAHGPDASTYEKASTAPLKPVKLGETMAFMFESTYLFKVTDWAHKSGLVQDDYNDCWKDLKNEWAGPDSGSA